jgi:hypothetical protein
MRFNILLALIVAAAAASASAATLTDYELVYRIESPYRGVAAAGKIELTVFPEGIRGDSLLFAGYARSGDDDLIIMNRVARIYSSLAIESVTRFLGRRLQPGEQVPAGNYSLSASGEERMIAGLPSLHYRVHLGPESHLDIWITEALEESEVFRRLTDQVIGALAAPIAPMLSALPGMPVEVVLQTRRFPHLELLSLQRVSYDSSRSGKLLKVGRFYLPGRRGTKDEGN